MIPGLMALLLEQRKGHKEGAQKHIYHVHKNERSLFKVLDELLTDRQANISSLGVSGAYPLATASAARGWSTI